MSICFTIYVKILLVTTKTKGNLLYLSNNNIAKPMQVIKKNL